MRKTSKRLLSLWILVAVAVPAWGLDDRDGSALKKGIPHPNAAGQPGATAPGALPESDCRAYAQSVVKAVAAGKLAEVNALVDWDALLNSTVAGLDVAPAMRLGLLKGMKDSIVKETGIAGQLVRNVKGGGSFTFLRAWQNHGRQVVLFRLIQPAAQGGFNYFEFAPYRAPGGQIRASDIYIYMAGEFFSETLRRALLPVLADQSRSFLDKLMGGEKDYVHDFPEVGRAGHLLAQGKPAEALAIYNTLRPETRKQKVVLLGRLGAAQAGGEKEYAAVIEEFRTLFPNDPCLDIISIDAFVLRKDYDGAIKAIDRLERSVGGDAYLDMLRAALRDA
jgi:hypothetical protein